MSGCPHFDLTAPETYRGGAPREVFKYLRNEQPIYWHEDPVNGVGFWAVTKQKDLDFISKNPQIFSSEIKTCFLDEVEPERLDIMRMQMINMDPPKHLKFRRLVRSAHEVAVVVDLPQRVDHDPHRLLALDVADRQLGVVDLRLAEADHDAVAVRAERVRLGPRLGPADPARFARRRRGLAVQRHRPFAQHPRPVELQRLAERRVELVALARQHAVQDVEARGLQQVDAGAAVPRVRVHRADDDALHAGLDRRRRPRRGPPAAGPQRLVG